MANVIELNNVSLSFGGLKAVNHVDFQIKENELVGLIGPNGAGKTTVFNLMTGIYTPDEGEVKILNKNIRKLRPDKVALLGISRTFQSIRLFKKLSVIENVLVAFNHQMKYSSFEAVIRSNRFFKEEKLYQTKALELLKVFHLDDKKDLLAEQLPYGEQRKLEIARALALNPKVLLLDEPAAGMNENETLELMKTIHFIKEKFNVAIVLIEHDMKLVMGICERIIVLNFGEIIAVGNKDEILNNKEVIKAYLGE